MIFTRTICIIILSVQFSFCPTPPRMVKSFQYNSSQLKAMENSRKVLENLGYNIEFYTKESFLIKTSVSPVKKDLRRYDYSIAILIEDYIQVFIIAQKHVFKRGSETSIGGGKSITEKDAVDWLPYSLQQKIFWPLIDEFSKFDMNEFQNVSELHLNQINSKIA